MSIVAMPRDFREEEEREERGCERLADLAGAYIQNDEGGAAVTDASSSGRRKDPDLSSTAAADAANVSGL
jgi:hypothetical protein